MLHRLIYRSRSQILPYRLTETLEAIGRVCERRNPAANITGALLHHDGWFVQALEGGRLAVTETMRRIMSDPRHDAVELMDMGPIARRAFPQFEMVVLRGDDPLVRAELAAFTTGAAFDLAELSAASLGELLIAAFRASLTTQSLLLASAMPHSEKMLADIVD